MLEACLASLDGAAHACVFPSGLASCTTITHLLDAGDHIVSMDDMYGGINRYFRKVAARMNIETSFVDATVPSNIEAAIRPNTRMGGDSCRSVGHVMGIGGWELEVAGSISIYFQIRFH